MDKLKRKAECAGNESKKQRSVITLVEKAKIIRMHENGKISTIARDTNRAISTVNTIVQDKVRIRENVAGAVTRAISTVNTIVQDKVRIRENVAGAVTLKRAIITKKRLGLISEMEKL
ncbi:CENP-B N-terminal DNA-binding domain [Popillia japonica]|uniref:CENP-B N-terminal DNA-binding domain n=1 Tax=Popillia japonica TaxID=7064 RepID=A0AAW1N403_POPJA